MKQLRILAAALAVGLLAAAGSAFQGSAAQSSDFRRFLQDFEDGTRHFINGDADRWKQHASQREDVTILGGFGGYEKGWQEVGPRYDWAAARFRESRATLKVQYLTTVVGADLAYTVSLERSQALAVGQDRPAPMVLRVTHVFRKEDGQWKLVHRHADPLVDKTAPSEVLRK
jgi:ketosteroid isomerase-like protein